MKVKIKTKSESTQKNTSQFLPAKEGFISKMIRIIIDDIKFKFTGERSSDRDKWDAYWKFCELSKGNR